MLALLAFFWDLAWLRRAPQDLPASLALLGLLIGIDSVLGVASGAPIYGVGGALSAVLLSAALLLLMLYGLLAWRGRAARFQQTATAIFGLDILFSVGVLALALVPDEGAVMVNFAFLALFTWLHIAVGGVLRHALNVLQWQGFLLAIAMTLVGIAVVEWLIPRPLPVAG